MTLKSVSKRIRLGKGGKIFRRAMALGHSRSNKTSTQMQRKKRERTLPIRKKTITRYF